MIPKVANLTKGPKKKKGKDEKSQTSGPDKS